MKRTRIPGTSLADNRKLTDEGVTFRSHIDGSKHLFTPEKVVDIERTIGHRLLQLLISTVISLSRQNRVLLLAFRMWVMETVAEHQHVDALTLEILAVVEL